MNVKDEVFAILYDNKGSFVSGEDIAEALGVSRAAVSKAVNRLRGEGVPITSANRSGHRLESEPVMLYAPAIERECGIKCTVLKTVDSTNNEAKRRIANGEAGEFIIAAEAQTAGRGRRGNSFYSPCGTGLYFTLALRPDSDLATATGLTTAAAVASAEALSEITGVEAGIQWVNDLYIGKKKICGILSEAVSDFETGTVQSVVIGIGINLNTEEFPEDIREKAGSVGRKADRSLLCGRICGKLRRLCALLPDRAYMDEYRRRSIATGQRFSYIRGGKTLFAVAETVDDEGILIARSDDGSELRLSSGEISIKL